MDIQIKSYEEFVNERKKYDGNDTCFVAGCNKPAYYEGGDYRFYCSVCEEHARIKESYISYLLHTKKKIRTRMSWDKNDPTLAPLLKQVCETLITVKELTKNG